MDTVHPEPAEGNGDDGVGAETQIPRALRSGQGAKSTPIPIAAPAESPGHGLTNGSGSSRYGESQRGRTPGIPLRPQQSSMAQVVNDAMHESSGRDFRMIKNDGASVAGEGGGNDKLDERVGVPVFELYQASRGIKSQRKCQEGCLYFLFVCMYIVVVFGLRQTSLAGETTEALLDLFIDEEFRLVNETGIDEEPFFHKSFRDIRTLEEWWLWLFGPVMQGLYPSGKRPLGNLTTYGLPMGDGQIYVMGSTGGIILRTSRAKIGSCNHLKPDLLDVPCFSNWEEAEGARRWAEAVGPGNNSAYEELSNALESIPGFSFVDGLSELRGSFLGTFGWFSVFSASRNNYGPDGFAVELPVNNRSQAWEIVRGLYENAWLDIATRVAAVEFNTYNPANQIVTCAKFLVEFGASGRVRPLFRMYHLNAGVWTQQQGLILTGAVIFMLMLVWYTSFVCWRVISAPRIYRVLFRRTVAIDLVVVILLWVSVVMWGYLTAKSGVLTTTSFAQTLTEPKYDNTLYGSANLAHSVDVICAINLVFATVKLIDYFPSETTRTIWRTLVATFKDLVVLGLVMFAFALGFALSSHLCFGALGFSDFQRVERAFGTLMLLMFSGDIDYEDLLEVSSYSAPVFYGVYMVFMWGVMLNLFVAIIVLGYEKYTDVRKNYRNWASLHHLQGRGQKLIMLWHKKMFHKFRLTWTSWYWNRLGAMIKRNGGADLIDQKYAEQVLEQQMRKVMEETDIDKRRILAEKFGKPWRRYLRMQVRRIIYRIRADTVNNDDVAQLAALIASRETVESKFTTRWKDQYEAESGLNEQDRKTRPSLFSFMILSARWYGHMLTRYGLSCKARSCCYDRQVRQLSTDSSFSSFPSQPCSLLPVSSRKASSRPSSLLSSIGESLFGSPQAPLSREPNPSSVGRSDSIETEIENSIKIAARHYNVMGEILRQEQQVMQAKLDIEKILNRSTKLYRAHNISFSTLLRRTWNNTPDEDRVQVLLEHDMEIILAPPCIRDHRRTNPNPQSINHRGFTSTNGSAPKPCKLCEDFDVVQAAKDFVDNYNLLYKRDAQFRGNIRRRPRL